MTAQWDAECIPSDGGQCLGASGATIPEAVARLVVAVGERSKTP